MMSNNSSMTSPAMLRGVQRSLAAALVGVGLGVGAMSLVGFGDDAVAIEPVSVQDGSPPGLPGEPAAPEAGSGDTSMSATGVDVRLSGSSSVAGSDAGVVDQAAAERAALAHVGEGRVTWVSPEDDYGAAWEIEVTLPDGREVDVYVDASGQVVHTS